MIDFEARMLSGEPFTLEDLKRSFSRSDEEAQRIEYDYENSSGKDSLNLRARSFRLRGSLPLPENASFKRETNKHPPLTWLLP
jgi:hypothetical protein